MEDTSLVVSFHLGYMLSASIVAALMHGMILIVAPDLTERETNDSWRSQIRILQFLMYLPLVVFFFTYMHSQPSVGGWFLVTTIVCALLSLPVEAKLKPRSNAQTPLRPTTPAHANSRTPAHAPTPALTPKPTVTPEEFKKITQTHLRILLGNFALGLLMGAAILLPFIASIGTIITLKSLGLISQDATNTALKLVPALCSLCIPIIMPVAFLTVGPLILRYTQGARLLLNDKHWADKWQNVANRAKSLGYSGVDKIKLFELPWNNVGFKNAFYIGLPSKLNPFSSAVFLVQGIDNLLNTEEIDFVLSHEAAHGLAQHTTRRITLGAGVFMIFVITQVMAFMLRMPLLSLLCATGSFLWGYALMKKQSQLQELEADILAINLLGGSEARMKAAVSALKKLDQHNIQKLQPTTEKRIACLEAVFKNAKGTDHLVDAITQIAAVKSAAKSAAKTTEKATNERDAA